MKKTILSKVLVAIFFIGNIISANAATLDDLPDPSGSEDELPGANIDLALVWLLVFGVLFGMYIIAQQKQKAKV